MSWWRVKGYSTCLILASTICVFLYSDGITLPVFSVAWGEGKHYTSCRASLRVVLGIATCRDEISTWGVGFLDVWAGVGRRGLCDGKRACPVCWDTPFWLSLIKREKGLHNPLCKHSFGNLDFVELAGLYYTIPCASIALATLTSSSLPGYTIQSLVQA